MLKAFGTFFGTFYGLFLLIQMTGLLYCALFFIGMASGLNNMDSLITWVLPVAVSVSLAVVVMILSTKVRPWDELCEAYPVRHDYKGKYLGFQTMKIGPVISFSACVSVGFDTDSVNVKLFGFPLSKKMQIPWSEVAEIREHTVGVYSDLQFVLRKGDPLTFCYSTELKSLVAEVVKSDPCSMFSKL